MTHRKVDVRSTGKNSIEFCCGITASVNCHASFQVFMENIFLFVMVLNLDMESNRKYRLI